MATYNQKVFVTRFGHHHFIILYDINLLILKLFCTISPLNHLDNPSNFFQIFNDTLINFYIYQVICYLYRNWNLSKFDCPQPDLLAKLLIPLIITQPRFHNIFKNIHATSKHCSKTQVKSCGTGTSRVQVTEQILCAYAYQGHWRFARHQVDGTNIRHNH